MNRLHEEYIGVTEVSPAPKNSVLGLCAHDEVDAMCTGLCNGLMAVVDSQKAMQALRELIPKEYKPYFSVINGGVSATVIILDRASTQTTKSIHGDITLQLKWDSRSGWVTLQGEVIPLSQLATRLNEYDELLNWSAIQA